MHRALPRAVGLPGQEREAQDRPPCSREALSLQGEFLLPFCSLPVKMKAVTTPGRRWHTYLNTHYSALRPRLNPGPHLQGKAITSGEAGLQMLLFPSLCAPLNFSLSQINKKVFLKSNKNPFVTRIRKGVCSLRTSVLDCVDDTPVSQGSYTSVGLT